MPGNQHDGGQEERCVRSVDGPGFRALEAADLPEQAPTLQFVPAAGFEGPGARAPTPKETADGVQPNQEASSALAHLRQNTGSRLSERKEEETSRREALTGFRSTW